MSGSILGRSSPGSSFSLAITVRRGEVDDRGLARLLVRGSDRTP